MNSPTLLNKLPQIARSLIPRVNFPEDIRTRHFAFLFKGRRIINIGWNSFKSNPRVTRLGYPVFTKGLHAEMHTLLYSGQKSFKGLSLAVLRINWNDKIDISKPCPTCSKILNNIGLRSIYYTDENGNWANMDEVGSNIENANNLNNPNNHSDLNKNKKISLFSAQKSCQMLRELV